MRSLSEMLAAPAGGGRSRGRTAYLGLQALRGDTRGRREAQARRPQGAAESRGAAGERGSGEVGRANGRWPAHFSAFPVGFTVREGGLRTLAGRRRGLGGEGPGLAGSSAAAGRERGGSQSEPPLRASAPRTPPQLRPRRARRPAHLSAKSTGALGPDSTRADRTRCGAGRLEPERRTAASRPGSYPQPTPPSPRGSPGLPPGIATQPSTPRRPAPDLAVYLSSSPRRAPGRPRPRGDIRALGSGSRPHLQAPVAAWEAPRPATGGGSAEPALPAPSQCPLAGLAPSPEGVHLFPRRAPASCFGPEKWDRKGRKADLRAREPAPSVAVPGASSAPVMRRPGPGGPDNPVGGEAPEGHLLSF